MKKELLIFAVCLSAACFGMAGCGEEPSSPGPEPASQVNSLSSESKDERNHTAVEFTKAYLSGDKEQIKEYLADPSKADVYSGAAQEDIETVYLQAISKMQPDGSYILTCGFQVKDIPGKQYLDMHFQYVDGQWKVTNYYLQA